MTTTLLEHEGELVPGTVVERPNRFIIRVRFGESADAYADVSGGGGDVSGGGGEVSGGGGDVSGVGGDESVDASSDVDWSESEGGSGGAAEPERVHLGDPGALRVLQPGCIVLCRPVDDPSRKTAWDAIAVYAEESNCWVSLRPALANDLFVTALEAGFLTGYPAYDELAREPALPDHGRADVELETDEGPVVIEVKSCTHVEDGVAKFPDRQTKRGRKHLRGLRALAESGTGARLVFVVQRPDAAVLWPFREVDPEFADLLAEVREAGVCVHAISVAFEPPKYVLTAANIPVELV